MNEFRQQMYFYQILLFLLQKLRVYILFIFLQPDHECETWHTLNKRTHITIDTFILRFICRFLCFLYYIPTSSQMHKKKQKNWWSLPMIIWTFLHWGDPECTWNHPVRFCGVVILPNRDEFGDERNSISNNVGVSETFAQCQMYYVLSSFYSFYWVIEIEFRIMSFTKFGVDTLSWAGDISPCFVLITMVVLGWSMWYNADANG